MLDKDGNRITKGHGDMNAAAIALANRLLIRFDVDMPRISSLSELPLSFFSKLFLQIFHTAIPDTIDPPCSMQDEVHNLQSMIDTLSLDILNISLSHITGEDLALAEPRSVYNLLEIFLGYAVVMTDLDSRNLSVSKNDFCELCRFNAEKLNPEAENLASQQTSDHGSLKFLLSEEVKKRDAEIDHSLKDELLELFMEETADQDSVSSPPRSSPREVENITGTFTEKVNFKPSESAEKQLNGLESLELERLKGRRCDLFDLKQAVSTRGQVAALTEQQIRFLANQLHSILIRPSKPQQLCEKAVKRQEEILKLKNKDIIEKRRLKSHKESQQAQTYVRNAFDTHSMRKARGKQYVERLYVQHRNRMMTKDKIPEEVMVLQLLKKRLKLQKDELHAFSREMRDDEREELGRQQNRIASMENFYEDQLSMLAESLQSKKREYEARKKARAQRMRDAKIEYRRRLEHDIKWMQNVMLREPFT